MDYIKTIYDKLCFALTNYETHAEDDNPDEYKDGETLYRRIVDIVNFMSEHM